MSVEANAKPRARKGFWSYDLWVRRGWPVWVLAATIFAADQVTKLLIVDWLRFGQSWPAEGWLRITLARNTGAAFSLFEGQSTILSIVAIAAVGLILWLYSTSGGTSILLRLALGLQLGGAFGNLIDRFRFGYVVDFIDVGPWPIFNVADSSISMGIALLIAYVFFGQPSTDKDGGEEVAVASADKATCPTCERRRQHLATLSESPAPAPTAATKPISACPTCEKARAARRRQDVIAG